MIKKTAVVLALAATLLFGLVGTTFAGGGNPNGTGQPSQSCQAEPMTPGHAASAPGSAFNPTGNAGTHYAGTQPQNSNNPHSVAQYDVACFHVSQNHP
jgi:hypothetical protein